MDVNAITRELASMVYEQNSLIGNYLKFIINVARINKKKCIIIKKLENCKNTNFYFEI